MTVLTPFEGALFATLAIMVVVWFVCVRKLSHQLRDRHPDKYERMGLAYLWPRNLGEWLSEYDNGRPVFALLRFLLRGEDAALRDADVSRLTSFMRQFFYVYLAVFLLLIASFCVRAASWQPAAVEISSSVQPRERAFGLHRERKWAEAVAAYDELLAESVRDAELHYWRGMAHWQLGEPDRALRDFRRVIELEPANFDAHRSADRILSGERRWDEILEMWNRYIARAPANAEAYFERGGTNYRKGNLVAAQADAARACELGKAEACPWAERLKRR
jgi:tetratricopeptide (TPR) repeat protein